MPYFFTTKSWRPELILSPCRISDLNFCRLQSLDWTSGLDWWTGLVDWH